MKIDEREIRKTINLMKPDGQLFEVRVLCDSGTTYSGYFRDADSVIDALNLMHEQSEYSVYITLNYLNDACYDRNQKNMLKRNPKNNPTTSDKDVEGYDWLMIDLDPKRPSGTSATDEQIQKAKDLGNKVYAFMKNQGFEKPLLAFSGNGVHLLYKVELANEQHIVDLISTSLKTLNMLFSTDEIDVDMTNFNPSRICKLYGTMAQKGASSEKRPHRMSYIVSCPEEIKATDIKYLEQLCEKYPKEEKPQRYNNYQPRDFDLDEWLSRYYIRYKKTTYSDGEKYILDECPFDSNHKGKDACIFRSRTGAIGFHCFHNSCSGKTWRDVRMHFEPDAYEKRQMEYERRIYSKKPPIKIREVEGKPVFYTAKDILNIPKEDETFIKTGISDVDKRMRGLKKGLVSVVSGLRGGSKSTVLSQIALDAMDNGFNVGCFSGELAPKNFMRWMYLQCAGKGYVEPTQFEGYYNVPRQTQTRIAEWMGEKFFLWNNDYGNSFESIREQFQEKIYKNKLDLLILDNLMAFNISNLSDNKYDAQTAFIWSLQRLAKECNVHVMFVAHPRKAMGFLRLDDISGTADLANAVDNAFIVHRVNNDFKRLSKATFAWRDDNPVYEATNVIEIAKDRDGGTQDVFVPLFYEVETKRLKNYVAENKIYGWNRDDDGFSPLDEASPFDN